MPQESKLVGLLYPPGITIKNFQFDERKFLNGLTLDEVYKITEGIKFSKDFKRAPKQYQEIIDSLKKGEHGVSEKPGIVPSPAYFGAKENVEFIVNAMLVEYDRIIRGLANKYGTILVPTGLNGSIEFTFFNVYTGDKLPTKSTSLDLRNLERIFRSVNPTEAIKPSGFSTAFNTVLLSHNVIEESARYGNKTRLELRVDGQRGKATTIPLRYSVLGEIQYAFVPKLGYIEEDLRKFGIKDFLN